MELNNLNGKLEKHHGLLFKNAHPFFPVKINKNFLGTILGTINVVRNLGDRWTKHYSMGKVLNKKEIIEMPDEFEQFCNEHLLVWTTSKVQDINGTIEFTDMITDCQYTFHRNTKYIRRYTPGLFSTNCYPLNPTKVHYYNWTDFKGETRKHQLRKILPVKNWKEAEPIIVRRIKSYRKRHSIL